MGYKRAHLALSTAKPKTDQAKLDALIASGSAVKRRKYEKDIKDEQDDWMERNDIVISRLIECAKGQENTEAKQIIMDMNKDDKTAKEICDALMARFDSVDARVVNASVKRFASMRAAQGEKATSYITRLKEAKQLLQQKGKVFSDGELVGRLLDGLSGIAEYEMTVAALETVKGLRFEDAVEHLQTKDETIEAVDDNRNAPQEIAAVAVTSSRNPTPAHISASADVCQICKKRGHTANKCHHRYKGNPVEKNQKHGQGGGKNKDKKDVECYNCGKKGHYARDCRLPKRNSGDKEKTPPNKQEPDSKRRKQNNGAANKGGGKGDWDKNDEYSGMMQETGNDSDGN